MKGTYSIFINQVFWVFIQLKALLIHLTDGNRTQILLSIFTGMIMFDLERAFDIGDHEIIYEKLQSMGIGSVDWFTRGRFL